MNDETDVISLHKPHPSNIVKQYVIKQIIEYYHKMKTTYLLHFLLPVFSHWQSDDDLLLCLCSPLVWYPCTSFLTVWIQISPSVMICNFMCMKNHESNLMEETIKFFYAHATSFANSFSWQMLYSQYRKNSILENLLNQKWNLPR